MYNMEKIPTAKEFYLKTIFPVSIENNRDDIELWFDTDDHSEEHLRIMIEFAKLHVEAALKEAKYCRTKECIQKCYPLDKIE